MVKAKLKRKKKKWFKVVINIGNKEIDLGEILAYELKDIIGKTLTVHYDQLSGNHKDQKAKATLKVVDTKENKGVAEIRKVFFQDSFINQRVRRDKGRDIVVLKEKSKDGENMKVKAVFSSRKSFPRSKNSKLLKEIELNFRELVNSAKTENLFDINFINKETAKIREKARKIYPIDKLYLCKVSII